MKCKTVPGILWTQEERLALIEEHSKLPHHSKNHHTMLVVIHMIVTYNVKYLEQVRDYVTTLVEEEA